MTQRELHYFTIEQSELEMNDYVPHNTEFSSIEIQPSESEFVKAFVNNYNHIYKINSELSNDPKLGLSKDKKDKYKPSKANGEWELYRPKVVLTDLSELLKELKFRANQFDVTTEINKLDFKIRKLEKLINDCDSSSITTLNEKKQSIADTKKNLEQQKRNAEENLKKLINKIKVRNILCNRCLKGNNFTEQIVSDLPIDDYVESVRTRNPLTPEQKNYANEAMRIMGETLGIVIEGDVAEWKQEEWGNFYSALCQTKPTLNHYYELGKIFSTMENGSE